MIMRLWGKKSAAPFMLTHFFSGVGMTLSPLIVKPFLSDSEQTESNGTQSLCSPSNHLDAEFVYGEFESYIKIPYAIIGVIIAIASLGHLFFVFKGNPKEWPIQKNVTSFKQMINPASYSNGHPTYGVLLLIMLFILYAHVLGGQMVFSSFLSIVTICSSLQMSSQKAASCNSLFFSLYTIGRLFGALYAKFFSVNAILAVSITVSTLSMVCICIWGQHNEMVFTLLLPPLALSTCLFFPSGMAWANANLTMNSMSSMVLIAGSSFGQIIYVFVAGNLSEKYGPVAALYVSLAAYSVGPFVFAMMLLASKLHTRNNNCLSKNHTNSHSESQ